MTAPKVSQDGNLPGALRSLDAAIAALCDPRQEVQQGKRVWADSWYDQLVEACPGHQGQNHNPHPTSSVPFWVDAVEKLKEIDTAVWTWQRDPGPFDGDLSARRPQTPETVRRLRLLRKRGWRPQDCDKVDTITGNLHEWRQEIDALLNPVPIRTLMTADGSTWASCPACGESYVYRKGPADDHPVRTPTLQMTPDMATVCINNSCRAEWGPQKALFLCKVLGYPIPDDVQQLCEALGIPIPHSTDTPE